MEIKNTRALKKHNKNAVLTEIINRQPISRSDLSSHLEVSHTTVSNLINELIKEGFIVEKRADSTGGRPPKVLSFKGEHKYIISTVFKERLVLIGIFNMNSKLLEKNIIKVKGDSFVNLSIRISDEIDKILKQYEINKNQIEGMGVSIPGIYQKQSDRVIKSNIGYLNEKHIKENLKNNINFTDLYIENSGQVETFYEWNDKFLRSYNNLTYIFAGDHITSGNIVDKKLYTGSFNKAGAIEHLIVKPDGKECSCGNKGCLNTIISLKAVEDSFNESLWKGAETNIDEMFDSPYVFNKIIKAYLQQDPLSQKIIDHALKYFTIGLSNIINILDPEIIVLGGLFDDFNETMLDNLLESLKNKTKYSIDSLPILKIREKEKNYPLKAVYSYIFQQWKTNI